MIIRSPESENEWEAYFMLRWLILRAPWNQARGTEKDETEFNANTFHAMAISNQGDILGVARLHFLDDSTAQIRYMAVSENAQGTGLGSKLIQYLEHIAQSKNIKHIMLQARENAVKFYLNNNYIVKEKSFLLYDQIQHFLMEKNIQ